MHELPITVGANLAKLRRRSGKKQSEVASLSRIETTRISRIEQGEVAPSLKEVQGFLRALGDQRCETAAELLHNRLRTAWPLLG